MTCDWAAIAALYRESARLTGSPVVELNRAIAMAETEGPQAGLRIVGQIGLELRVISSHLWRFHWRGTRGSGRLTRRLE